MRRNDGPGNRAAGRAAAKCEGAFRPLDEPHSAEILAQDLENASMSITEAEKKIKAFADGHKTGSFACVTPGEADAILREFYGLGTPGGTAVESGSPKILNLADFL